MLVAVLVAGAMHALLLGGIGAADGPPALPVTRTPLLVRMLSAEPTPERAAIVAPVTAATPSASDEGARGGAARRERDAAAPSPLPLPLPLPSHAATDRSARAGAGTGAASLAERPQATPAASASAELASPAPSRAPALRPAPDYLLSAQLDPRPAPLDDIDPVFPPEAGTQEGMVVLRVLISEAGAVDEVAVIRSAPTGLFERAAIAAFQAARFSPGMVLGRPVKSQINVQVDFSPFNRGATVSGRGY